MNVNKNENCLSGDSTVPKMLAGALSGNQSKVTDVINLFPYKEIKHALSVSGVGGESPLYLFLGLFEVAKSYISFNECIDECIREDFNALTRSMDFYLDLVKAAYRNDL